MTCLQIPRDAALLARPQRNEVKGGLANEVEDGGVVVIVMGVDKRKGQLS